MNLTDSPTRLPVDLGYTYLTDHMYLWFGFQSLYIFSNRFTRCHNRCGKDLKLSDISGLPVAHAPRGLSFAFLQLIETNCQIHALTIGDPCQSFPPWHHVMEKGGGD